MSAPDSPATIMVNVLNGTSTSGGTGPGYVELPEDEALHLIGEGLATRGQHPHFSRGIGPSPVSPP
jgi:hypothetical protein